MKRFLACSAIVLFVAASASAALFSIRWAYPDMFFDQTGALAYTAGTQRLSIAATPVSVRFAATDIPTITSASLAIDIRVDPSGAGSSWGAGDDLVVQGTVTGKPGLTGVLVTGRLIRFGYLDLDAGSTTDKYTFLFRVTGGTMAGYFPGQVAAISLTSEHSNFDDSNGSGFTRDFAGGAKGDLTATASLGDFVWQDGNADGIQDGGEAGMDGVLVKLFRSGSDPGTDPLATLTTAGGGKYVFTNLEYGSYFVVFARPDGFMFSPQGMGGDAARDSNPDPTGQTAIVTLGVGGANMTIDAGLARPPVVNNASLGDLVWEDSNGNGVQDAGEAGIGGVTVSLYASVDNALVATTTTDASGNYLFPDLAAGSYSVVFDAPIGYVFTRQGTNPAQADVDSNPDAAGMAGQIDLQAGETNTTIDAGLYRPVSLGDLVWEDLNGNGIQDGGEPGVFGVTVNLYDGDEQVAGTSTGGDGRYSFADLAPGSYVVQFVKPDGYAFTQPLRSSNPAADSDADTTSGDAAGVTLLSGESDLTIDAGLYRPASVAGFVYFDANNNGIKEVGEAGVAGATLTLNGTDGLGNAVSQATQTDANGAYSFTDLVPGTYTIVETQPAGYLDGKDTIGTPGGDASANDQFSSIVLTSGVAGQDNNLGELLPASLMGYAYVDCNNDGQKGEGERGIEGVSIALAGTDSLGNNVALTATTDGNGFYSFNHLLPGIYQVTEAQPAGYLDGLDAAGSLGGLAGNDVISQVVVAAGNVGENYNFGEIAPSSLSGYVYVDLNNNGLFEPTLGGLPYEEGIEGVTVTLYMPLPDGTWVPLAQDVTDDGGAYTFDNLYPGTYRVAETQPAGWIDGKDTVGTIENQVVGVVSSKNVISGITIVYCSQAGINYNFGEMGNPTLGQGCTGTIGFWANKNGQMLIKLLGASSPAAAGTSTALGNWLADTFPNMYGTNAGQNNLAGKTTAYIAQFYVNLKDATGQKLSAQILAVALAVYTTTTSLNNTSAGQSFAIKHGFHLGAVTDPGNLNNALWNVGDNNEAFGVPANSRLSVMNLLLRANAYAVNGVLWPNSLTVGEAVYSATTLQNQANVVFSGINEAGDI